MKSFLLLDKSSSPKLLHFHRVSVLSGILQVVQVLKKDMTLLLKLAMWSGEVALVEHAEDFMNDVVRLLGYICGFSRHHPRSNGLAAVKPR